MEECFCEYCCNFDKEHIGMDGTALCKLTKTLSYCEESAKDCKFFNIPTADVAEVIHAKWLISSDSYFPFCSNCNNEPFRGKMTKYCPECGAKMDKE